MTKIKLHGITLPAEGHTLITGQPGSGKTRGILRPLLQTYLSRQTVRSSSKTGMLLIDPKGDMLPWVTSLLESIGRQDDLVTIGEKAWGFNLFTQLRLTRLQYASRILRIGLSLDPLSEPRPDESYWSHQQRQMLLALIEAAECRQTNGNLSLVDLSDLYEKFIPRLRGSFDQTMTRFKLQALSAESINVFKNFSRLPNDTYHCVLSSVGNCLDVFRHPPLHDIMNPAPDRSADLAEIIEEGKCVVVSCATRSYGESTLPLISGVKEAFADLILSRSQIEVKENEWRPINQDREILYVADEAHRALRRGDGGGELDFLDTCREFKCRGILATQSISSLNSVMGDHAANRLVALCANHFFLNNIDPLTRQWAEQFFSHHTDLPPLLPNGKETTFMDWEGPSTLSRLKKGEFLLRTGDGRMFRRQVSRNLVR